MRYVNLKKRNTSKYNYLAKKFATSSLFTLILSAALIIPFANQEKVVNAAYEENAIQEVCEVEAAQLDLANLD